MSQIFDDELYQSLEIVGYLAVDGLRSTNSLKRNVLEQRRQRAFSGRPFVPWWLDCRAGLPSRRADAPTGKLSGVSKWPRVERLIAWDVVDDTMTWNLTSDFLRHGDTGSEDQIAAFEDDVEISGIVDAIFYRHPDDAFYYASAPANTTGLLKAVAEDAALFRKRRDCFRMQETTHSNTPIRARRKELDLASLENLTTQEGILPSEKQDNEPFEILLRQLNVSSYVASAASPWVPSNSSPDSSNSPLNEYQKRKNLKLASASVVVSGNSPRHNLRKRPSQKSGRCTSHQDGKTMIRQSLTHKTLNRQRSKSATVTPEGRALPETFGWRRWLMKLVVVLMCYCVLPVCALIATFSTPVYSIWNRLMQRRNSVRFRKLDAPPFSVCLAQIEIRIRSCAQWPAAWLRLRELRTEHDAILRKSTVGSSGKFVSGSLLKYSSRSAMLSLRVRLGYNVALLSSASLLALDLVLGWLLAVLLFRKPDLVLWVLHKAYNFLHIDVLRAQIDWLMGFPAGLKLNDRLNVFIGEILFTAIDTWNEITSLLAPMEPHIVRSVGLLSMFGASFLLAVTLDILAFCTLHVFYIYVFVSQLTRLTIKCLQSLFYLFRGLKWNALRFRVDSCEYNIDQLLIGSIAFTCLLLLLPTILVFYLSFVSTWLMVLCTQSVLQFALAVLNHFPLYLLISRWIFPISLPSGVTLSTLSDGPSAVSGEGDYPMCYWVLEANSVSFQDSIIKPFAVGLRLQFKNFNPLQIISCILSGRIIHMHGSIGSVVRSLVSFLFPEREKLSYETSDSTAPGGQRIQRKMTPNQSERLPAAVEQGDQFPFVLADFTTASFSELVQLWLDALPWRNTLAQELMVRRSART
eukprot:Gregarina_sp_Poly_1__518@NODE_1125_length_5012_cov_27_950051_g779_i0_p1_GENE_NODE_1125_length_5012_cov_27_950051_g779_i0NODE_1125_length_5012_cov_27_950051_g779_i0_p1_ORF_typecomplete_len859_score89_24Gpi1/PF05024_15/8_2e03Gpi1/PF05024_15/7_7e54_NODE_1125_length_5012_cov_27_950051_g779_i03592935